MGEAYAIYRDSGGLDVSVVVNKDNTSKWYDALDEDEYILMQYTGLKDKNGKEIYEGDVIKWNTMSGHIEYSSVHAAYIVYTYNDDPAGEWLNKVYDESKIIGNIFTNPELLRHGTEA